MTAAQRICLAGVRENIAAGNPSRAADAARSLVRLARLPHVSPARGMTAAWIEREERLAAEREQT